MSFRSANLKSANPLGAGGSVWVYKTEDTTTGDSGYFPAGNFGIGDVIYVTVVTNMDTTDEAWVSTTPLYVTTKVAPIETSV